MGQLFGIDRRLRVEPQPHFVFLALDRVDQQPFRRRFEQRIAEEVADGGGHRSVAVHQLGFEIGAGFDGREARDALVHAQPLPLVRDVIVRDLDVEAQVKRGADFRLGRGALQFLRGLLEHSQVKVDADGVQVAGLLRAQQVPRAAQFEVQRRQAKARAQV